MAQPFSSLVNLQACHSLKQGCSCPSLHLPDRPGQPLRPQHAAADSGSQASWIPHAGLLPMCAWTATVCTCSEPRTLNPEPRNPNRTILDPRIFLCRPSGPEREPRTPDSLEGVSLQQRTPARTPITPDVRLYHRAVVVAQEPAGEARSHVRASLSSPSMHTGSLLSGCLSASWICSCPAGCLS